jgi:hypothetical protein
MHALAAVAPHLPALPGLLAVLFRLAGSARLIPLLLVIAGDQQLLVLRGGVRAAARRAALPRP